MNDRINKYISKLKEPKVLVIIGFIGIALIFFSSIFPKDSKPNTTNTDKFSVEAYREGLEEDVCDIVKGITGSKSVTVVVTLESSMRYKYADVTEGSSADKTENDVTSTSSELKQGYITVKQGDGGEEALLVTTQMPEVRGVAIVCDGGDNSIIAQKIENTVTAALNITSQRIYIAGGNSNEKR